jgi:hypothetical protein
MTAPAAPWLLTSSRASMNASSRRSASLPDARRERGSRRRVATPRSSTSTTSPTSPKTGCSSACAAGGSAWKVFSARRLIAPRTPPKPS